jgi:hypothetical protein
MRKLRLLIAGLAVSAVALAVARPGIAQADTYHEWLTTDGFCMGVQGGNMTPGTPIITWKCDESSNQLWTADYANAGAPNTFLLRNAANSNDCLSVFNKATYLGAPLVIWPCKGTGDNQDQRWYSAAGPTIPIYNGNSGLQILPLGGQNPAVVQWDGRVPYAWTAAVFVNV